MAAYESKPTIGLRVIDLGRKWGFFSHRIGIGLPQNGQVLRFRGVDVDLVLFVDHVAVERDLWADDFDIRRGKLEIQGAYAVWDNRRGAVRCAGEAEGKVRPNTYVKREEWRDLAGRFAEEIMSNPRCADLFAR